MRPDVVIIGLGNPGKSYEKTRHNAGFRALDALADAFGTGSWKDTPRFAGEACEARIVTAATLLLKPHTYMNRSGEAAKKVLDFYKLDPAESLLVCCDDIDLSLGTVRLRRSGGPGTHNGLKSIHEHIGSQYARLRIGIGSQPQGSDLATWVLSAFSKEEEVLLAQTLASIAQIVQAHVLGEQQDATQQLA